MKWKYTNNFETQLIAMVIVSARFIYVFSVVLGVFTWIGCFVALI